MISRLLAPESAARSAAMSARPEQRLSRISCGGTPRPKRRYHQARPKSSSAVSSMTASTKSTRPPISAMPHAQESAKWPRRGPRAPRSAHRTNSRWDRNGQGSNESSGPATFFRLLVRAVKRHAHPRLYESAHQRDPQPVASQNPRWRLSGPHLLPRDQDPAGS